MSCEEEKELNELLESSPPPRTKKPYDDDGIAVSSSDKKSKERMYGRLVQWTSGDGKTFFAAGETINLLPPGVYEIGHSDRGIFFQKIPTKTEGLIRFPQTNIDKVVSEISNFWEKEDKFKEFKLVYKRGVILWGIPGGGKSCCLQLITEDVINRGGVVVKFGHPSIFSQAIRQLKEIQRETPVVVLMEDIESILEMYNESEVLNILDGVDDVHKCCFLATTNYPERLGARIMNRPSRFDKRFKIGYPNAESRKIYFEHLLKDKNVNIDINEWVARTEGFSIAHLKEVCVNVLILGNDFEETIKTLDSMREQVQGGDEFDKKHVGFVSSKKRSYCDDE